MIARGLSLRRDAWMFTGTDMVNVRLTCQNSKLHLPIFFLSSLTLITLGPTETPCFLENWPVYRCVRKTYSQNLLAY